MSDPMTPLAGRTAYLAALLFGIVFAVTALSWHAVVPVDPLHAAFVGDEAQSVIGQRYFLGGPWSWPPLAAPGLGSASGVNIALTDSIPLAMLLLKPVRGLLSPGASASETWVALMLALQPVAAVFALRAADERRAMPTLAVAVLAVCMPALLARFGHSALCSHAAILAALGLYLRAVNRRPAWAAAVCLMLGSLLIHPYILADVAALLAAAPLTLLLRGDKGWRRAAGGFAAGIAGCGGLAALLGYGGSRPAPGFGVYSMNLLAPLLPVRSALFPDLSRLMHVGDPFEGYQYLGAGVLILAAAALIPAWRARARWRRHAGLLAMLAGLTAFSLSNDAYAGTVRLFHWGALPDVLLQFRATSRFFWPVAYAILIAGVATTAGWLPPGRATLLLAAAVAAQWADTGALRRDLHRHAARGDPWQIDEPRLRPVFAAHQRLALWPVFGCGAYAFDAGALQTLLIASQTRMLVNTIPTARDTGVVDCDPAPVRAPLAPGELRWLAHAGDAWLVPDTLALCRRSGQSALCSAELATLAGFAPLTVADLPPGQTVTGASPSFAGLLGEGWSVPDSDGVWSDGDGAVFRFKAPPGPVRLTLGVSSLAPGPGGTQMVQVFAAGALQAEWSLPDQTSVLRTLALPPCGQICTVELHIGHPVRPVDRGMSWDARRLGVFLRSLVMQ